MRPIEGKDEPNLYYPQGQMNFNIKVDKVDVPIIYLMKKDHSKPFGDFTLEVIFTNMRDYEVTYNTNNLMFGPKTEPIVFKVLKSASARAPIHHIAENEVDDEMKADEPVCEKVEESKPIEDDTTDQTDVSHPAEQSEI